jgi:hypothetical protein
MVEFVSYNGAWPNLCSGTLVLRIDGEDVTFPKYCMRTGGRVWFDKHYNGYVEHGKWSVDIPEKYANLKDEIEYCVNKNVRQGCCGGCL